MKILLLGSKGRFEQVEERIGEVEDRPIDVNHSEEQKEKKLKKNEQSKMSMGHHQTDQYMHSWIPKRKREVDQDRKNI